MSNRLVILVLCGIAIASSAFAGAHSEAEIREAVESMLTERHPDNRPERWIALGEGAPQVIIDLIRSTESSSNKMRLIGALAYFNSDSEVARFLKEQVEASPDPLMQRSALRSYGVSQGAQGSEFVSKFLSDVRPEMRLAAAQTLQLNHDPVSDAKVNAYLVSEKTAWVATKISESAATRERGEGPGAGRRVLSNAVLTEAPDRAWDGDWKGFSVRPDSVVASGLRSDAVTVKIRISESLFEVSTLATDRGIGGRSFPVFRGARFIGKRASLEAHTSSSSGPGWVETATGELSNRAGGWMIEVQFPRSGGFLILRKP